MHFSHIFSTKKSHRFLPQSHKNGKYFDLKTTICLQKAEYKAAAAATSGATGDAEAAHDYSEGKYGAAKLIQSQEHHEDRVFTKVSHLSEALEKSPNQSVWVRGRVHTSRAKGKQCFLILRQQSSTVQCVIAVNDAVSKQMVKFSGR